MGKTVRNVLKGVATLEVWHPDDELAQWSQEQVNDGETWAVKLSKLVARAGAGSTHLQIVPVNPITMAQWTSDMASADKWEYWYRHTAGHPDALVNFEQIEFRFEDPDSEGWVEITALPAQNAVGDDLWAEYDIGETQPTIVYWGKSDLGASMSYFLHVLTVADCETDASAGVGEANSTGNVNSCADWLLTRIRFELYEHTQVRNMYLGNVRIHSVEYTVEPGGTAEGMSLSSPYTEVGYTEDGVVVTYTADEADTEVDEETFPIDRVLTKETLEVTCNMAESSLFNIDKAMAGSVLSGSILKLGGGVNKKLSIQIRGLNPAGFIRAIQIPSCTATGSVGMSYTKDGKTIVPVTFQALKTAEHPAVTIVDNVA